MPYGYLFALGIGGSVLFAVLYVGAKRELRRLQKDKLIDKE